VVNPDICVIQPPPYGTSTYNLFESPQWLPPNPSCTVQKHHSGHLSVIMWLHITCPCLFYGYQLELSKEKPVWGTPWIPAKSHRNLTLCLSCSPSTGWAPCLGKTIFFSALGDMLPFSAVYNKLLLLFCVFSWVASSVSLLTNTPSPTFSPSQGSSGLQLWWPK
jgi:hypothetical protein